MDATQKDASTSTRKNSSSKRKGVRPEERFPVWLRKSLPLNTAFQKTQGSINRTGLSTVCEEALCPNRTACWSRKTATYLALGSICTRKCGFCNIDYSATPPPLDPEEPQKISDSVRELNLRHVVITMVSRDDLPDGGASMLAKIVQTVRKDSPEISIEVLSSDFQGNLDALHHLLNTKLDIFNHNVETTERLSPFVRHKATYHRSLKMLEAAAKFDSSLWIKSGIMVGLGETEPEVRQTLKHLAEVGVKIVTIGQYLQPNRLKIPVKEYVTPETYDYYRSYGESLGLFVYAGPFVRSSYNADVIFDLLKK
ncbi:lipoyl synthase [Chlamydiifrater phoenicopteri]|uniref:lipoyl synthase n=1 Tax=Chlamydiifrater phoenicopteri TaxID=2681469 RepID=UPI001BCAB7F6|nr:lipoyl synthase [Chlamydiifrater phoenicopteri]